MRPRHWAEQHTGALCSLWRGRVLSSGSVTARFLRGSGWALLGAASEEIREAFDREVVRGGELSSRTEATITDPHKLFEELRTVGVRGFALDLEECEEGLCCAAAPVYDTDGRVVAAVSVSGPQFRLSQDRLLAEVAPRVVAAGERLSRELGFGA